MPNKTLYVKDADLPLFEQAQEHLGDSVSSMFAEFLRERVASLAPEESRIVGLVNEISRAREAVSKQRDLPQFIEAEYEYAEEYAKRALKSFQHRDIRKAKVFFYAASTYKNKADGDLKQTRGLNEKMAEMLNRA